MGPLLRQPAGQNRGNLRGDRNRIGFRSEVALNQGFRANSGARPSKPGPAMRLNWVLLPREPDSASFYGVFKQAPLRSWSLGRGRFAASKARQNGGGLTSWRALAG